MNGSRLFPAGEEYTGPKLPFYFLVLIATISTVRSLIHIFAADGDANSIAGITVNVAGGTNIIAMFAQWGASQLILAFIYWFVILRYRSLTPLMLAIFVLEQVLRIGAGNLKPLEIAIPPPGAIGSEIVLPLPAISLVWSLWQNKKES